LPVANAVASGRTPVVTDGVIVSAPGSATPLPSSFRRPTFDSGVHSGVSGGYEYVAVPAADGSGMVFVLKPVPGRGPLAAASATVRFLRTYWWQFLLGGAVAAGIALLLVRWLARGMTKPLRDMANATRRMARGDYSARVETASRDEVGALAEAFNRMSAELESLERLRRELVANVSHELKTPATSLKLLAESLEQTLDEDPVQARLFAAQLRQETERLAHLISDLLDLTRLESQEPADYPTLVDVRGVLMTVLARMRRVAREKDIILQWKRFGKAARYTVYGDETQLTSMFTNLVDNAVKYTPPGGRVEVVGGSEGSEIIIKISDTGIGIPEDRISRIFERFYRVDRARSKATGGTGLGLSIVRHVAQNHGGRVTVESTPNEGSTFTVYLPRAS
jgi:signal transduction histidine kinase